ncbi:MAG: cell division protein FtsK, partial [Angustibacter sp.]
ITDLRAMVEDMRRRYKILRSLPRDICPEGKVTDELASKKTLGLHPVVLALDECQRAFEHPDHGKEIASLVEDLVKRGPAVGIIAIPATQRPDVKSLPPGISSNAVLRFCLKVAGQIENDMVLGTSSYRNGVRATMFTRKDRGVGYLAGEGDDPQIVRTSYIDGSTAEHIVARARQQRIKAGRLTGHAAGITPDTDTTDTILDHLAEIWPTGTTKEWSETLAERLAETYPEHYPDLNTEALAQLAKNHGIDTRQIKKTIDGKAANRRGITERDLRAAITDRDRRRTATTTPPTGDPQPETGENHPHA